MTLEMREANWLPLPECSAPLSAELQREKPFPIGEIVRYLPNIRRGTLRIKDGSDMTFSLETTNLIPEGTTSLWVGQKVGYDLSWTPEGRKIRVIRAY